MDIQEDDYGRLFEELSLEKVNVEPMTPPFNGYGRNPDYWNWYGSPWSTHSYKNGSKAKDIVYLNKDNKRHREFGPAYVSRRYEIQEWWKDGKRHRVAGPAYIHKNNQVWFFEGKLHRLDGPAVDELGGPKQYWIHGQRMSVKEYKKEINRRKRKGLIK
jgi:hypothetical protein